MTLKFLNKKGDSCTVINYSTYARGVLGRLVAEIESIRGGKGSAYLKEVRKARQEALEELVKNAKEKGADAVIGVDFETNEILEGFIITTAYGTAVKLRG